MPGRNGGRGNRGFVIVTVVLVLILLAGSVLLPYSLDGSGVTQAGWDESSPFDTARSFLDVLGGIRETLAAMLQLVESEGLETHGRHHEIYLSDPRRVEPERLRTILRMPVR